MRDLCFAILRSLNRPFIGTGLSRIGPVASIYRWVYGLLTPRGVVVRQIGDHLMYLDTRDVGIAPALLLQGGYEVYQTRLMEGLLKPGMVVVDVGANIGWYALHAARAVGSTGRVYAFEPEPRNYQLLVKNIEANHYQNVIPVQKAVSNRGGTARLYLHETNLGMHSFSRRDTDREVEHIEVEQVSLDDFLDTVGVQVDLLKIDAEGAEGLVIEGANRALLDNDVKVFLEFILTSLENVGTQPRALLEELEGLGFSFQVVDEMNSRLLSLDVVGLLDYCERRGSSRTVNLFLEKANCQASVLSTSESLKDGTPRSRLMPEYARIARVAVSIVLAIVALWYAYGHRSELAVLFTVRGWDIAKLVGAVLLHTLVGAARFASLYRALGADMGVWESFGLSRVAAVLNTVLPAQVGGVARAVYLKRRYAVPYSQAPVIFLGSIVLALFVGAVVMMLSNVVAFLMGRSVPLVLWLGAVCAGAAVALLWVSVPVRWTSRLGRVGSVLRLFSDGWRRLRNDTRCLAETVLYQLLVFVVGGWVIALAYDGLGIRINLLVGISIVVVTSLSNLVVLTPANLGVQEAVVGYLSQLSGLAFVEGVAASMLIRMVGLVVNFVPAPAAWYLLFLRRGITLGKNIRTPKRQD